MGAKAFSCLKGPFLLHDDALIQRIEMPCAPHAVTTCRTHVAPVLVAHQGLFTRPLNMQNAPASQRGPGRFFVSPDGAADSLNAALCGYAK